VQSYLCYSGTIIIKSPNHQITKSCAVTSILLRNKKSAPPHRDLWGLHLFNQEHPLSNHHTTKPPNQVQLHFFTQEQKISTFRQAQGSALSAMLKAAPLDFSLGSA
jgi:LAS superfamily LD-carboxypeptidase LdcB